nr:hypothetical protein [Tanacetum cinerariifolium]
MAVKQPSKRTQFYERSNQTHPFGGCGGGYVVSVVFLDGDEGSGAGGHSE